MLEHASDAFLDDAISCARTCVNERVRFPTQSALNVAWQSPVSFWPRLVAFANTSVMTSIQADQPLPAAKTSEPALKERTLLVTVSLAVKGTSVTLMCACHFTGRIVVSLCVVSTAGNWTLPVAFGCVFAVA